MPPTGELLKDLVEISRKPSVESSPLPAMAAAAIERHEKPARHPLLGGMLGVAGRSLEHLGGERVGVAGEQTA